MEVAYKPGVTTPHQQLVHHDPCNACQRGRAKHASYCMAYSLAKLVGFYLGFFLCVVRKKVLFLNACCASHIAIFPGPIVVYFASVVWTLYLIFIVKPLRNLERGVEFVKLHLTGTGQGCKSSMKNSR